MQTDITILIPFLNEAENVPRLVGELNAFLGKPGMPLCEVIFIDDGSTDDSVKLLSAARHTGYKAKIVRLSKNYGTHAALRAGIQHASSRYICIQYADLQDPLELVLSLYQKIEKGYNIVWAYRNATKQAFGEKVFSRFYAAMMRRYAFRNFPEKGFDVLMFDRKVQRELNDNVENNSSIFLQILGLGFRQAHIDYDKRERKAGKSKWTMSKKIKLFIDSFVAFSFAPIRFVTIAGILMFFCGLLWTTYAVARELIFADMEPGWPTLISILMLGFGLTNISLGIIAEYLWRTLDASRGRKTFIIDEVRDIKTHVPVMEEAREANH